MAELDKHLYTTKDVQKVREQLYKEQEGIDPITGLTIPEKQKVLDHDHSNHYVRAVLHRQTNAVLGKIETYGQGIFLGGLLVLCQTSLEAVLITLKKSILKSIFILLSLKVYKFNSINLMLNI